VSFSTTVNVSWREDAGAALASTVSLSDAQSDKLDLVVNDGAVASATFPITLSKLTQLFILSNADVSLDSGGTDEGQLVTPGGSIDPSDHFQLIWSGQTTAPLAFASTAAAVQSALEALSNIGTGNVSVTGSTSGPWTVAFVGLLGHANQPQMTGTVATVASATITITTPTGGAAATETLSLFAGLPVLWFPGCGMSKPFASNVATLRATNVSGQQATVKVRVLTHP
jgi:hypothetical protein